MKFKFLDFQNNNKLSISCVGRERDSFMRLCLKSEKANNLKLLASGDHSLRIPVLRGYAAIDANLQ